MTARPSDRVAQMETMAAFINRFSDTLESLAMTTYGHVDLTPLFLGLGHFPRLTKLSLTIPLDTYHLDPVGLNKLLVSHDGLQQLVFRHRFCCGNHRIHFDNIITSVVNSWYRECFQGVSLRNLEELELGIKYTSGVRKELVDPMTSFGRLTSVTILEPRLGYDAVKTVVTSFSRLPLQFLSLFVINLSPQLFVLMAEKSPHLQQLVLDIEYVCEFEGSGKRDSHEMFCRAMRTLNSTSRQLYDNWKLADLEIWKWVYKEGRQCQWDLMRAVADSVPAVHSFSSRGHMAEYDK